MPDPQKPGLVDRAAAFLHSINPFDVAADTMKTAQKPADTRPRDKDGLLKGRSTAIFNENVDTLKKKGVAEAEAIKRARQRLMED